MTKTVLGGGSSIVLSNAGRAAAARSALTALSWPTTVEYSSVMTSWGYQLIQSAAKTALDTGPSRAVEVLARGRRVRLHRLERLRGREGVDGLDLGDLHG